MNSPEWQGGHARLANCRSGRPKNCVLYTSATVRNPLPLQKRVYNQFFGISHLLREATATPEIIYILYVCRGGFPARYDCRIAVRRGENFIPRPEWLLGRKKRKRRATSHSEATLRFLFVIPHGSRPPKEHRNPGSYNQSGGGSWIRTSEVMDNRFTVCPLWPLGNSPISFADLMSIA